MYTDTIHTFILYVYQSLHTHSLRTFTTHTLHTFTNIEQCMYFRWMCEYIIISYNLDNLPDYWIKITPSPRLMETLYYFNPCRNWYTNNAG